jgi:hypothetical protein
MSDRSSSSRRILKLAMVLFATVLGYGTVRAIGLLDTLPYSSFRVTLVDCLLMPGGLVGAVMCPGGVHGAKTAAYLWPYVVFWSNVLWYGGLWFLLIWFLGRKFLVARSELA